VNTDPLLWGPFAVGANPAGFVAGAVYGGFMNISGAKEPEIEQSLGAALGGTGDAQAQALTDLNRAITSNGWYVPVYEDFAYAGYNAQKVAEPSFAGTDNYLVPRRSSRRADGDPHHRVGGRGTSAAAAGRASRTPTVPAPVRSTPHWFSIERHCA
jgi:hypothetical protein